MEDRREGPITSGFLPGPILGVLGLVARAPLDWVGRLVADCQTVSLIGGREEGELGGEEEEGEGEGGKEEDKGGG